MPQAKTETAEAGAGLAEAADDTSDGVHDDQGHPGSSSEGVLEGTIRSEVRCRVDSDAGFVRYGRGGLCWMRIKSYPLSAPI